LISKTHNSTPLSPVRDTAKQFSLGARLTVYHPHQHFVEVPLTRLASQPFS
jgi:hypothetical protein